jgi:hypothetical protein
MLVFGSILAPALLIASAAAASPKEDAGEVAASLFCLSHSRFKFEEPRARTHRVRYLIDIESFEGQRRIMLFVEAAGGRTRWYDIEVLSKWPARRYRLVNHAEFVAEGKVVRFVDPSLGGIWANDRLAAAFAAIRLEPAIVFKAMKLSDEEQCRSFDDGIR